MVQDTLRDLSEFIQKNNAHIEVAPLPTGPCDPVQIRMVSNNLIINGIKFNQEEVPEIRMWSERLPSGEIQFAVQDNGIGNKEEFHQKVFGIFKRLPHRENFPGSSIGLALCAKIVERHNGKIRIESQLDFGSTFWFQLGKRPHPSSVEEAQIRTVSIAKDPSILIVPLIPLILSTQSQFLFPFL